MNQVQRVNTKLTYLQRSLSTTYGKDLYEIQAQSKSVLWSPVCSPFLGHLLIDFRNLVDISELLCPL